MPVFKLGFSPTQINRWIESDNHPTANSMLLGMLGSDQLVEQWWLSPNKAFDNKRPVDVDQDEVRKYLMFHTFGYGGS